jgi:hypothetical protein
MIVEGKFIIMRRNRLGVLCNNGVVYSIVDINPNNCSYQHGDKVKCKLIDESKGICIIVNDN